jgi:anti-anti-sigma factor
MFKTRKVSAEEIVLAVTGSMTGDEVSLFARALDSLQQSSYRSIVLDLAGVEEVSSLFVGHILNCHRRLAAENRGIRICGCREPVAEILELLNVDKSIPVSKKPREARGD